MSLKFNFNDIILPLIDNSNCDLEASQGGRSPAPRQPAPYAPAQQLAAKSLNFNATVYRLPLMGMEWRDWYRDKKVDWDRGRLVDSYQDRKTDRDKGDLVEGSLMKSKPKETNVLPYIIVTVFIILVSLLVYSISTMV